MACLFALLGGLFPRFALIIVWIARPKMVDAAFDTWIWPLLGLLFLPFATLIYVVLWQAGGLSGWDWFWVFLARSSRPRPLGRLRYANHGRTALPLDELGPVDYVVAVRRQGLQAPRADAERPKGPDKPSEVLAGEASAPASEGTRDRLACRA